MGRKRGKMRLGRSVKRREWQAMSEEMGRARWSSPAMFASWATSADPGR